jgi:hypothetical protein
MELGGSPYFRRVRGTITVIGIGAIYLGPIILGVSPLGALLFLAVGGLPFIGYLGAIHTRAGSWLTGLGLLGNVVFTQIYVVERTEAGSSTAGVGYLYLLTYGLVILVLGSAIDAFLRSREKD